MTGAARRFKLLAMGLLVSSLALRAPGFLWAGAWTLPRGGRYLEENVSFVQTDEDINEHGERQKKPFGAVYTDTTAKTYIEYGLTDRWNIVTFLPYRRCRYVSDYDDINNAGFQDFQAGLKWRWTERPPACWEWPTR